MPVLNLGALFLRKLSEGVSANTGEQTSRELDPGRRDSGEEGVKGITRMRVMDNFIMTM